MSPLLKQRVTRRPADLADDLASLAQVYALDLPAEARRLLAQAAQLFEADGQHLRALVCRDTGTKLAALTRQPRSRPGCPKVYRPPERP